MRYTWRLFIIPLLLCLGGSTQAQGLPVSLVGQPIPHNRVFREPRLAALAGLLYYQVYWFSSEMIGIDTFALDIPSGTYTKIVSHYDDDISNDLSDWMSNPSDDGRFILASGGRQGRELALYDHLNRRTTYFPYGTPINPSTGGRAGVTFGTRWFLKRFHFQNSTKYSIWDLTSGSPDPVAEFSPIWDTDDESISIVNDNELIFRLPPKNTTYDRVFSYKILERRLTDVSSTFFGKNVRWEGYPIIISPNGSRAVFTSTLNGLVPDDFDFKRDIFINDNKTGSLRRVVPPTGKSGARFIDECNLRTVLFPGSRSIGIFSCSKNWMIDEDLNESPDIYMLDLDTGALVLGSRGLNGELSDAGALYASAVTLSSGLIRLGFSTSGEILYPNPERKMVYYLADFKLPFTGSVGPSFFPRKPRIKKMLSYKLLINFRKPEPVCPGGTAAFKVLSKDRKLVSARTKRSVTIQLKPGNYKLNFHCLFGKNGKSKRRVLKFKL